MQDNCTQNYNINPDESHDGLPLSIEYILQWKHNENNKGNKFVFSCLSKRYYIKIYYPVYSRIRNNIKNITPCFVAETPSRTSQHQLIRS